MTDKDQVLLELVGEIHQHCVKNNILYYLDYFSKPKDRLAYSPVLRMDAEGLSKFLKTFKPKDNRALEWLGNNFRFSGKCVHYINENTVHYSEDRLMRELHLGMFVTIDTEQANTGINNKIEKGWNYYNASSSNTRLALANAIAGTIHKNMLSKTGKKKISKKRLRLVSVDGVEFYILKKAPEFEAEEQYLTKAYKMPENTTNFFCDTEVSYRDLDLKDEKRCLAETYSKRLKNKRLSKEGEAYRVKCAQVTNASFYRYHYAIELIKRYGYDALMNDLENPEIKGLMDEYMGFAEKLHSAKRSIYIGERFTKVVEKRYPSVDTKKLYEFTAPLLYEGVKIYDYNGNLIEVVGGKND